MRERVVCNASPLIFLAKIGKLDLLDSYKLHVPAQVASEISRGLKRKKGDARLIQDYLLKRKGMASKVSLLRDLPRFLGQGEGAVISLAVKEKISRSSLTRPGEKGGKIQGAVAKRDARRLMGGL